ncbi:hypothetical protein VPH35_125782 [Triticum aestivum]
MSMKKSEGVGEFALKLTSLVNEMRALGSKMEDIAVVEKLLRAVPDKFLPIVVTIEQWGDVTKMSVMEVIGRLKNRELGKPENRNKEENKGHDMGPWRSVICAHVFVQFYVIDPEGEVPTIGI